MTLESSFYGFLELLARSVIQQAGRLETSSSECCIQIWQKQSENRDKLKHSKALPSILNGPFTMFSLQIPSHKK